MLTKDGIKPVQKKVQAVLDLQPPTTLKQLRSFLGMVQFYRDMWKRRSHILAPLTDLVGVGKKKLKWTEVHQKAFEDIKKVMARKPSSLTQISMKYLKSTRMPVMGNWVQLSLRMENP